MSYEIESFGISDLGLSRKNNEDAFHAIPIRHFFVLADGMGGHNAGEIAAKEAIHHLSTSVSQLFAKNVTLAGLPNFFREAIIRANLWVHCLSEQKKELSGMGTTLCCLMIHQKHLVYAHVGDSRIYRFRNSLEQITKDHSSQVASHLITRAIGRTPHVEPDVKVDSVDPDDIYLLCSDGLTNYVSDTEIASILSTYSCLQQASQQMIQKAKFHGGGDNITVLILKVKNAL
jgi:PPM family protein phosphatase